ncbi:MAG: glycosyltransferase family 2 protein [Chitinophagales bacterium]
MERSGPLISIITPTLNAGQHIGRCLSSVQDQTFRDFEHLILDGGSTDDTIAIVRTYANQYSQIKLRVDKDKGIYDAMNKGIALAVGKWFYFLGADDTLMDSGVLEKLSPLLSESKAQFIYGNVFFQELGRDYDHEFDMEKILKRNICHQAIFYHESVFRTIGNYAVNYKTQADYDLNLKCWLSGKISHEYIPVTIANYAQGGLSSLQPDGSFREVFPKRATSAVLAGNWTEWERIRLLSIVFRKIILRYGFLELMNYVFDSSFLLVRIAAFFWMCLTSPAYLFSKKN